MLLCYFVHACFALSVSLSIFHMHSINLVLYISVLHSACVLDLSPPFPPSLLALAFLIKNLFFPPSPATAFIQRIAQREVG